MRVAAAKVPQKRKKCLRTTSQKKNEYPKSRNCGSSSLSTLHTSLHTSSADALFPREPGLSPCRVLLYLFCDHFHCNLPLKYADLIEFNCIWKARFPFGFFHLATSQRTPCICRDLRKRFAEPNTYTENLFLCWWEKWNSMVSFMLADKIIKILNNT